MMDHALTTEMKMVVENDNYTFQNVNEPAMAETTIVSNILPDPVLESAKSLLDSMSTSRYKIAKMIKPAPAPLKYKSDQSVKSSAVWTGYQKKNAAGPKINRYRANWRHAVPPQIKIPDVKLKTTVASNEISLTLEPVPFGNNLHKVPYYARNRSLTEFTFQPMATQIIEVSHDKMILEWHRKHIQKLVRLGPSSKSRKPSSNLKTGNGINLKMYSPSHLGNHTANSDLQTARKRKYSEISNRYYQYLNKPKRARHDAFQVIYRSRILLDHEESVRPTAVDDRTLYPRKFLTWPSGKVTMPGYYPQRYFDKNTKKNNLKRKRTWSMYRVPKPRPLAMHRVPSNKNLYSSIMKKLWNKKLAAEDRLKWNPTSRKFLAVPAQSKSSNPKQWFRFPSIASRNNPIHTFNMSTNSQVKKYSTVSPPMQPKWKTSFKHEPIRNNIAPPRAQHKLKDIQDIFKCKVVPNPIFFESFEIYSNASTLYQIRRLVSFKAMKQGRLEKKVYVRNEADCEGLKSETAKRLKFIRGLRALSSSVLINSSTETMLSSWSTSLDKYSLTKTKHNANAANQNKTASKRWLHICSGAVIDSFGIAYPDIEDADVPKEVLYAWALDEPCNDTFTTTNVINSSSQPSDRSRNKDGTSGKVLHHEKGIGTSNGLLDSIAKMQRLRSRLKCSPCTEVDMRHRKTLVPKPGYCVRYRFGFCSFDCACESSTGGNTGVFSSILPFEPVSLRDTPKNALLSNEYVESVGSASPDSEVHTLDVVAKVSDPRRISEEINDSVIQESADYPKERDRRDTGIIFPSISDGLCAESAKKWTNENTTHGVHSLRVQKNAVANTTIGYGDHDREELCSISNTPLLKETHCLYRAEKSLLSRISRYEHETGIRLNYINSRKRSSPSNGCEPACNAHSETGIRGSDCDGSHCCDAIGRSCFEVGHALSAFDNGKPSVADATNHDSSNSASASEAVVSQIDDGMGNSLGKRTLLDGLGTILQNHDCSETSHFTCEARLAVVSGGIQRSEAAVDKPGKNSLSPKADHSEFAVDGRKPADPPEWMVIDSTFGHSSTEESEGGDSSDRLSTLRSYAGLNPSANDTKTAISELCPNLVDESELKKAESKQSTFCNASELKTTVNRRQEGNGLAEITHGSATPCVQRDSNPHKIKVEADFNGIEDVHMKPNVSLNDNVKQEINNAEGDDVREGETRSSRRLRSRANCKKRGRYETDYVSDIPKVAKKPKKVYPTNDYDNEEFWQFYSRCENTVYSQNLLLQYKYIKLFKCKGITSDCTPLPTQFSNSISSLPASNKKRPAVPKSGIMSFLEKYTKQRKAPPDLPTVSDLQCAYCGRSFVGRDRKEYEGHVARHGMQYQVLSVPRLPKKKKKILKTAKKEGSLAATNGGITNDEAKEILLANSQNQRFSFGGQPSHSLDSIKPLSRPSFITMGHRKQTARKSFSIASTLPKDVLIAALQCEMRAKSAKTIDPQLTRSTKYAANGQVLPQLPSTKTLIDSDVLMRSYLPQPSSARKTLTGLPITYDHLDRNFL